MELLNEIGIGKDNYRGHKMANSTKNSKRRKTLTSGKNSNVGNLRESSE